MKTWNSAEMVLLLALMPAIAVRAQNVVLHPYVWKDAAASTLISSSTSTSATFSDSNVVASSGYANRHDWRVSQDGVSDRAFGPTDYFDLSADVSLTGSPISPRKEAGLRINSACGDSLFIVNTDSHEVIAFGGAFPTYDFRAHGAANYNSGDTIHLRIQYLEVSGTKGFILTAGSVVSPFLPAANASAAICSGSTVGGYLQIQRASTAPNAGSASFTNITFSTGAPVPPVVSDEVLLDRTEAQACRYAVSQLVTTPATTGFPNGRAMLADSTNSGSWPPNSAVSSSAW